MAPGNDGDFGLNGMPRSTFTLRAIALTLGVHAGVLLVLWWPTVGGGAPTVRYAEVGLVEEMEAVETATLEEQLRAAMEGQVANLRSDAKAAVSSDRRSSASDQLAAEVEAELRAFEAAEMARLAAEEKDFGLEAVPEVDDNEVETLSGWDAQYEGNVTVKFDLPGRRSKYLDVPGYRCRGGATVVVRIAVNRQGEVKSATLDPAAIGIGECFADAALRSARRSTFFIEPAAESVTEGTLTYIFVPQ